MPTQPRPATAGRRARIAHRPQPAVAPPKPHRLRPCHWVTVSARRIQPDVTPAAVPQTQLLQACVYDCGRHRTRILPGHWQARDLVHPAAQRWFP